MTSGNIWDQRYSSTEWQQQTTPVDFLADNIDVLPKGKALDIAMGQGRNSLFLAERGFEVTGIDSSQVAIARCEDFARQRGLTVTTILADLTEYALPKAEFDVVVNCYYLQRDLISELKQSLRVGGVVVFETCNTDHIKFNPGMNPDYLLQPGELLQLFRDYSTLVYREGIITNPETGKSKSVSSLIARKNRRG